MCLARAVSPSAEGDTRSLTQIEIPEMHTCLSLGDCFVHRETPGGPVTKVMELSRSLGIDERRSTFGNDS